MSNPLPKQKHLSKVFIRTKEKTNNSSTDKIYSLNNNGVYDLRDVLMVNSNTEITTELKY